ncbi:MAG: DNA polymerase III subunit beta [Micavibrio sp.]|jgi:DNA polymerase-3 subunit beta|nr:MAG: DNA polymerase III subunit beta [Micavibrio sp.]
MKFSIDRSDLLRALSHVHTIVERRNTIPILANVLLKAEDGILFLNTTDMDLEVSESVPATVDKPGATTVAANTLYDIVRKLQDGATVSLELPAGENRMLVKSGRSDFRLGCLPVEDFPQMSRDGDMPHKFSIPASQLRMLIDRTRFAISNEETRYYLNGIFIHATESNGKQVLRAVATDAHRLARFEIPLPAGAENLTSGVIIPRKAVGEIRKLIEEAGDNIEIALSDTKMQCSFDHISLTTKLIDGTFPDYERVIPKNNDKILVINPAVFAGAVDRVSTIATEKSRAVKLTLNGKTLTLSATSPESGSASEEIEVTFDSDPVEIGFNAAYLMDVAKQMESDGCRLTLADSASPTIIQDVGDENALYVLMPMRV